MRPPQRGRGGGEAGPQEATTLESHFERGDGEAQKAIKMRICPLCPWTSVRGDDTSAEQAVVDVCQRMIHLVKNISWMHVH